MVRGRPRRDYLEAAIADFDRAISENADDVSAYIGLGGAHRYLAQTYPACREGKRDADALLNWRHLQRAIGAYDEVIARGLEDPQAYASRGLLHLKELGLPGWVRYSKRLLSCPDGALAAPVDETVP